MTDYRLEEIVDPEHPLLEKAVELLRRRLIPGKVQEEEIFRRDIGERLTHYPDFHHFFIIRNGKDVAAFSESYYIKGINAGYFAYNVVDEAYEGNGLATKLRKSIIDTFVSDSRERGHEAPIGYLGEVEPGSKWFEKLQKCFGAIPLNVKYLQPPLRPGQDPLSLILYLQPQKPGFVPDNDMVKNIVWHLYRRAYSMKPEQFEDKPFYKQVIESIK